MRGVCPIRTDGFAHGPVLLHAERPAVAPRHRQQQRQRQQRRRTVHPHHPPPLLFLTEEGTGVLPILFFHDGPLYRQPTSHSLVAHAFMSMRAEMYPPP